MTNNDDAVWKLYAKGVEKIRKRSAPIAKSTVGFPSRSREGLGVGGEFASRRDISSSASSRKTSASTPPPSPPTSGGGALTESTIHNTLDHRIEKKLRQGEIELHARIDLHGMTQVEAHAALARFVAAQVKAGKRNLLIITGKGRGNEGVLRTNLPIWLRALPEAAQILTLRPAAPKHGGGGAFYVMLKKPKPDKTPPRE